MKKKKHVKTRLLPMDELLARPCEVDGRPALFHRWMEEAAELIQPHCEITVVHRTYALVEYRDGTIGRVAPERVKFIRKEPIR